MRINFYPLRQFQGGFEALGAAGPVGLGLAAAQTALGIVQAISGGAKAKRLLKKRRPYQTPDEIFKILQATENKATSGYDPETLQYLTGSADNALSSSLSAATRLGADPNTLSNLLDQRISAGFRIGAENQLRNMQNFGQYINSLNLVADNKAAEQKSKEDILKDQLQAASAMQQMAIPNIVGGANTALSVLSSANTAGLYAAQNNQNIAGTPIGPRSTIPATPQGGGLQPPNVQIGGRTSPNVYTPEQLIEIIRRLNLNPNRPQ